MDQNPYVQEQLFYLIVTNWQK